MDTVKNAEELVKGDILKNTNHGFEIEIVDVGKKNVRYINLETGEKVKNYTRKFNFMLREGVFTRTSPAQCTDNEGHNLQQSRLKPLFDKYDQADQKKAALLGNEKENDNDQSIGL